ncbi:MAG: non-canonical purine NTP pyrophosphatase, partial [Stackebrandtia sp.]
MTDRTIIFVTGNAGKLGTARTHLEPLGFSVEQVSLDLDEIQSTTVADVAIHKAQQAHRALRRPVMVEDSGFGIDELDGWPGPLIKPTLTALGPEGLCRVADLTKDRAARFTSVLVYIDQHGIPRVFTDEGEAGTIAKTPSAGGDEAAWSPLWDIFIPATADTTLSTLSSGDRDRLFSA